MSVDKMNTEQKMRNHFTFFRSFQEAIDQCEEKDQLTLYRGIVNYALDHVEPVFDNPLLKLAWTLIKPNLDKGIINWGNGCKGGAPLFNANAKKNNQETTEKQPKNNQEITEKQRDRKGMDRKGMDKEDKESKPKKDVSLHLSPEYVNFIEWLNMNCPHLLKMKIPNEDEYNKLLVEADGSKKKLTEKLLSMENDKNVPKKRRSIYRTCSEWLYNDKKKNGGESITTR